MISQEIIDSIPQLLYGATISLLLAIAASFIGIVGGTILALIQTQGNQFSRKLVAIYTIIFRGTPMLIQITFLYILLGGYISAFATAIIAIGLNSSAYVSQIVRSGIMSVSFGQIEAAKTLGISNWNTIQYIILPQALRIILPSLGNEFITLIKDTSLAYTIGVMELFMRARVIISITYDPIPVYIIVALIYLTITTTLSLIINYIEKSLSYYVEN